MYSNDYSQIKSGFVNYLGACIQALPDNMNASAKSHFIVSEMIQQITQIAQKEDGTIDLFIYKPVFRSVIYVLKNEIQRMYEDRPYTQDTIDTYNNIIKVLNQIVDKTEENHGR